MPNNEPAPETVYDPRDDGCLCQGCHRRYKVDIMLPDTLWQQIRGPEKPNLLCGICITSMLELEDKFAAFDLTPIL